MRRLPLLLTAVTAMFLTICVLEAMARGLNPPLAWDAQPAWWQSDLLADFGWRMALPSLYIARLVDSRIAFALSLILTVVLASLLVFYVTRVSVRTRKA
jgi:hypothetical protein